MFERRLRVLLSILGLCGLVVFGRLAQLQVVHGEYYRQRALDALELPPTYLPFVRGSIMDRGGEVLVSDEPAWDLTIEFPIIALKWEPSEAAFKREYRRWRRATNLQQGELSVQHFEQLLSRMWADLAIFCERQRGYSAAQFEMQIREIFDDIQTVRRRVATHRGFDAPVAEETSAHSILTELAPQEQIAARELLASYPWIHVEASSYRKFADNVVPFSHVLGRMGAVDADTIERDRHGDDPFAKYLAGERAGISGVEWAGEEILRGRRGQLGKDREGKVVTDIAAENGGSVRLSIVGDLQRRLYHLLGSAVESHPESNGGAIVVLDVATREVLALVSYPSYDPSRYQQDYEVLRDNTQQLPLLFRAVATRYQPGSTVKPLACLAGLFHSVITPDSQEECQGALFPENPDRWRCWEIHGSTDRMIHGLIDTEQALTGSCNIFMYKLGEKLGVERLTNTFDMAGIGRPSGIGLREDEPGINPTPSWLMRNKNVSPSAGAARQFAIGQAELSMTPVQVANLMATYASGKYRPVTLLLDQEATVQWTLPGTAGDWAAIRRGIYGVVNDPDGTAYKYAHFEHDRYALCGKTGSATTSAWPTAYRIPYVDEYQNQGVEIVREGAKGPAIDRFRKRHPLAIVDAEHVEVAQRWPESAPAEGGNHSHAWFAGYLQQLDTARQPDWSVAPKVAFAVLIEFGGSGGRTSGPLGKQVAGVLLEVLGDDLDAHRKGAAGL